MAATRRRAIKPTPTYTKGIPPDPLISAPCMRPLLSLVETVPRLVRNAGHAPVSTAPAELMRKARSGVAYARKSNPATNIAKPSQNATITVVSVPIYVPNANGRGMQRTKRIEAIHKRFLLTDLCIVQRGIDNLILFLTITATIT